ncbi:hypothetical protein MmmBen181_0121 [Mycoplasma mycoides subsp. mycoides]|nr:hypothetical protein MmmBen_0116 [Mycoplasma mycoides subsp. mycoides]AME12347.1 hypothetical protein MmmBen181_0121 [Mycoplasma mycoides subsp. mycoides]AME14375.1 hypothetical protein MmmBen468_0121 [Mycoplasma mycoides subsp. mycoides]
MIIFWILVGITTTLVYNLEWFIQKVIIFNGSLQADLNMGTAIIDKNLTIVFSEHNIKKIDDFYIKLNDVIDKENHIITKYYNININSAFKKEGLLFSAAALIASFISGPILVYAITKKKTYKFFILPILLGLSIMMFFIMPVISSVLLLATVFTPLFGMLYSYRTALDSWATSVARKTNVKISFVRGFYEVGAGLGSIGLTQLLLHLNYYKRTISWADATPYYVVGAFYVILTIFLWLFMPDNIFDKLHVKEERVSQKKYEEVKQANKLNQELTLKQIILNKNFIIGLIFFLIVIGTVQAFGSIWVNTVENFTSTTKSFNSPQHIGYQKAFSIPVQLLLSYLILQVVTKIKLKQFLLWAAILASISWFGIGTIVYIVKPKNPIIISLIGGIGGAVTGTLAVALGYEFISRVTTINTRPATFVVFNSITYGFGGIIFVGVNTFLSKTPAFGISGTGGYWVWLICGISCLFAILLLLFFFKEPEFITREIDDKTFNKHLLVPSHHNPDKPKQTKK